MSKTRSTVYLSAAKFVGLAVGFFSVPLYQDWLGPLNYGAYLSIGAFLRYLVLLDVGLVPGATRLMIEAYIQNDRVRFWRLWWTNYFVMLGLTSLIMAISIGVGMFVKIADIPAGFTLPLCIAFAVQFGAQLLMPCALMPFNARKQFGPMATLNAISVLFGAVGALVGSYWFRTPMALAYGFALGPITASIIAWFLARKARRAESGKRAFEPGAIREFAAYGSKNYPNTLFSMLAGADKPVITTLLGSLGITHYALACKIPETLMDLLRTLADTMVPDLVAARSESVEKFSHEYARSTRIALIVGCALVFVPCAFGDALLHLWLRHQYFTGAAFVVMGIGFYRAMELYNTSLYAGVYAAGQPHRVTPFQAFNGLSTLLLTFPVVQYGGLVGVTLLNIGISSTQFVPQLLYLRKTIAPAIPIREHLSKMFGIIAICWAISAGGYLLTISPLFVGRAWLALLLAPLFSLVALVLCFGLNLAPIPGPILRRLKLDRFVKLSR